VLVAPAAGMGLAATGVAAARGAAARQGFIVATELLLLATAVLCAVLGLVLVLPAYVAWVVAALFLSFTREGSGEGRPARVVLATGALWTLAFAVIAATRGESLRVDLGLGAAFALALAGIGWRRALERDRDGALPAAVVVRPGACSSDPL
jgi:hypothetical protein